MNLGGGVLGVGQDSVHSRGPGGTDENSDFIFSSAFSMLFIQVEVGLRATPGSLPYQSCLLLISS